MAKIYLVRHCESEGNACRRTHAQMDTLVTRKGYNQCEALRKRFEGVKIDAVYSSDAYRSVMTVEPIAKERNLPVRIRIHLREITTGIWEDMAWGNIRRDFPEVHEGWKRAPWEHSIPGGTTFKQAADQFVFALKRIAREVGDGVAICASHSCTIKAGLCQIMGLPLSRVDVVGHGDNTAVSLIHVDADGNFSVEFTNDSSHLTKELARAWSGVAGDDVNMIIDPITPAKDMEELWSLRKGELDQKGISVEAAEKQAWLQNVLDTVSAHPEYVAMCQFQGKPVGYVLLEDTPDPDTGHIASMYIQPQMRGKGYMEQLFGYATHVFRYGGKLQVTIDAPGDSENQRVIDRFVFVQSPDQPGRLVLNLYNPPVSYPCLA